jgi:hypothetical protein
MWTTNGCATVEQLDHIKATRDTEKYSNLLKNNPLRKNGEGTY